MKCSRIGCATIAVFGGFQCQHHTQEYLDWVHHQYPNGRDPSKEVCACESPDPLFLQGAATMCATCHKEIECHVQPANAEERNSPGTGEPQKPGQQSEEVLTLLRQHSEILNLMTGTIREQQSSIAFLATQVKTLVDALAEDSYPDEPITSYLSGRPV